MMDKSRVYEEVMKRFRQASTAKFTSEKFRKVETALWLLEGELNRMLGQHSLDFWFPTLRSSIAEQGGLVVKAGAKHYKVSKKSGEWVTQIPFGNPEQPKGTAHSIIQALRRAGIKLLLLLVVIGGMLGYWWLA